MNNKTITIVGVGLLGGSYAMGLTKAGNTVFGIDTNENSINFAIEHGYIKDGDTKEREDFLSQSDIVVLCLYPNALIKWVKQNATLLKNGTIVTDVCGVKSGIVEVVQEMMPKDVEFYASHPMRGKEVLGVENADCKIFKDANFILTPSKLNTEKAKEILCDLATTLGFTKLVTLSPKEHDKMIGYVSQLTHAIAVSLMTANDNTHLSDYTGDSFHDLTRIAKINEHLWTELFMWNRDVLCGEIDDFVSSLQALKQSLKNNDEESLRKMFRLSTQRREQFDK